MSDERWTRGRGGAVLHRDSAAHVGLVLRTLGISEDDYLRVLDDYAARCDGVDADARTRALAAAWSRIAPHAASLPELPPRPCPACHASAVHPVLARRRASGPATVYGRCQECGHLAVVEGAASETVYETPDYYRNRDAGGAGYADYAAEREYREGTGGKLLDWIEAVWPGPSGARTLLEVGSGFGFTRRAAERRGWTTAGLDINPAAAAAARELYGFETWCGTLAEALSARIVRPGAFGLVLYQFVLEHLVDPVAELRRVAAALASGGALALVVPSADAIELDIFGASYRSLRHDHLHLFSRRSLTRVVRSAGLEPIAMATVCNLHLLSGFLAPADLAAVYDAGRGPDLRVLAGKGAP
jgi:SAM-dependent methyltransferase